MTELELKIEEYKSHIQRSYYRSLQGISKCSPEILSLDGMTGKKTRHLYNNLLDMPDVRYLEIGTWKGSSFCSAIYKNNVAWAFAVDNWSEFGGPKDAFLANLEMFKGDVPVTYIESDFNNLDVKSMPKFNVYLYDGPHEFEQHVKALDLLHECLDDLFIYIIDDWNWIDVRATTKLSIERCDLQILHTAEVFMTTNNTHTVGKGCGDEYWNGVCIFLLQKKRSIQATKQKCALVTTSTYMPL